MKGEVAGPDASTDDDEFNWQTDAADDSADADDLDWQDEPVTELDGDADWQDETQLDHLRC